MAVHELFVDRWGRCCARTIRWPTNGRLKPADFADRRRLLFPEGHGMAP